MTADVLDALRRMAGPDVAVAVEAVTDDTGLMGDEDRAVAKAIPKRRAEFAAGRRAARAALVALGEPPVALPREPNRSPLWPDGLLGSLSHDAHLAAAAVARTTDVRLLGLDLTEAADLPPSTHAEILPHPTERHLTGLDARLAFSAKETLFKALYPEVGSVFGFDAAVVTPHRSEGRFTARLTRDLGPFRKGETFDGQAARIGTLMVTFLTVR